jgi:RNA polymerase sigma-70 factor (ECF subfamily)
MPDGSPPLTETDEALLARAAEGDRAAFDRLAARWLPRLYRAALRLLDDPAEAEDVAQEAMLRAWRKAARFDPRRAGAAAWLHRIAVNLAMDRRRAARPAAALDEHLADQRQDAEAALQQVQRRRALAEGIAGLPRRQRAALALTYGEERPGREVARLLGTSARALEGLLRRARLMLRDRLIARDV